MLSIMLSIRYSSGLIMYKIHNFITFITLFFQ